MKRALLPTLVSLVGAVTAAAASSGCERDARAGDERIVSPRPLAQAAEADQEKGKTTTMSNVKRVSPEEAKALVDEGYTYVDVRSEPEFVAGHPEGSVNIPLLHMGPAGMTPNPEFMQVMTASFPDKGAKLVLGCRSGGRSLQAAEMLQAAGYTNIVDQRAGFEGARGPFGNVTEQGWSPAGLPVEEGASEGRSYEDMKKKTTGS